jgi:hypothetical protein
MSHYVLCDDCSAAIFEKIYSICNKEHQDPLGMRNTKERIQKRTGPTSFYLFVYLLTANVKVWNLQNNADWRDQDKWNDSDMLSVERGHGSVCPSAPMMLPPPPDIRYEAQCHVTRNTALCLLGPTERIANRLTPRAIFWMYLKVWNYFFPDGSPPPSPLITYWKMRQCFPLLWVLTLTASRFSQFYVNVEETGF